MHIGAALILAVLLGAGIGAAIHAAATTSVSRSAAASGGQLYGQATWPQGKAPAPAIHGLRDQSGRPFSLASTRGHTVVVAFFDSHCNQACPLEGRALATAERSIPAARRPVLVVVSVNPRDTAASSRAAVRKWGLAELAPWHWLRGSPGTLAQAWRAYRIFVAPPRDGDIVHTEAIYLLDRRGYERSAYVYPFAPRFVTADLGTLARAPA